MAGTSSDVPTASGPSRPPRGDDRQARHPDPGHDAAVSGPARAVDHHRRHRTVRRRSDHFRSGRRHRRNVPLSGPLRVLDRGVSGQPRKGNQHLQHVLVECAWAASRTPGYLQSLYRWHVRKFGGSRNPTAKNKAIVAVAHKLAIIIWHVLATGKPYTDLGADYLDRRIDPAKETRRLIARLQALGHTVTIDPQPKPANDQIGLTPDGFALPGHHRFTYQPVWSAFASARPSGSGLRTLRPAAISGATASPTWSTVSSDPPMRRRRWNGAGAGSTTNWRPPPNR